MYVQTSTMPICLRGGVGFTGLVVLLGILLGMFVLWSFSCLGSSVVSIGAFV